MTQYNQYTDWRFKVCVLYTESIYLNHKKLYNRLIGDYQNYCWKSVTCPQYDYRYMYYI